MLRLLESIKDQSFTNYEVIITDDSPDDSVQSLCLQYKDWLPLKYFKNSQPLGTPENWNEAVRQASGQWIKIMHDDDWFSDSESLAAFAAATRQTEKAFIFSGYYNVPENTGNKEEVQISSLRWYALKKTPVSLLSKNVIGPPSVTLYRPQQSIQYDKQMKWLVDMDFYIRYFKIAEPYYVDRPLVSIGIHPSQVTAGSKLKPEVEIPEHLLLLEKTGEHAFRNIFFYDAYWRLIRNLGIRKTDDVQRFAGKRPLSPVIVSIIRFQSRIAPSLLKTGLFSKLFMSLGFVRNYFKS